MQENNAQSSTRILGNTNARVLTATETEEVSGGRWWYTAASLKAFLAKGAIFMVTFPVKEFGFIKKKRHCSAAGVVIAVRLNYTPPGPAPG